MTRSRSVLVPCLSLGLLAAAAAPARAQAPETPAHRFMRTVVGFTEADFTKLDGGELVSRLIETKEKGEVAAFGAVSVKATPERFLAAAADVAHFRRVPEILEIGSFSNPPRVEDLAGLSFPDDDIAALRKCKPGKCDVKLGEKFIERLAREVDWSKPDAQARAVSLAKQALVEGLKAYQASGIDALGTLVDKSNPKSRGQEFEALLANSPYFVEYVPEFNAYLRDYPKATLAGAKDVFYWTKDNFGLKPVVSVYHLTLYHGPHSAQAAQKLLYASHYFNTALEFWALGRPPAGEGFQLLQVYRTRLDPPTGMLAGVLLGKVRAGVLTGVTENVKNAKAKTEAQGQ